MGDTIELISLHLRYSGNANVNDLKLQTLSVGDKIELIFFTFALLWN